jgi:hypothetical protein
LTGCSIRAITKIQSKLENPLRRAKARLFATKVGEDNKSPGQEPGALLIGVINPGGFVGDVFPVNQEVDWDSFLLNCYPKGGKARIKQIF